MNLGWKLSQVVNEASPQTLLDTYHAERHPVGARVLHNTLAQTALLRTDERVEALRETMVELLSMDEPRRRLAAMMSGLDIHYDLGHGVLLDLAEPGSFDIAPWADRVRLVEARCLGRGSFPYSARSARPPLW